MNRNHAKNLHAAYGYKVPGVYGQGINRGDEVLVTDRLGVPIIQDLVEDVSRESVKVGGAWWSDFEYYIHRLND